MTPAEQDVLYLRLTLPAVAVPAAYLVLTWRWPSRVASYGRSVAWWLAIWSPFVMAFACLDGMWPYGYGSQHPFRWGRLALDAAVGLVAAGLMGVLAKWLASFFPPGDRATGPDLPDVGPLWADRHNGGGNGGEFAAGEGRQQRRGPPGAGGPQGGGR